MAADGNELVWAHNGKVGPKDTDRHTVPLLQPGIYSFYLKKTEGVRAPMRTAHAEMRVLDDTGSVIFERCWKAIGGLDSAKDPTKARAQFDLMSQHLATRPGTLEVVVRSKVSVGKLSYRVTLGRRLRLVVSPAPSPRTSPAPRESTRKPATADAKEKRVSDQKEKRSSVRQAVASYLGGKGKSTKRDILEVDPILEACLSWFERSTINEQVINSLGITARPPEELQKMREEIERGEKYDLASSLEPECVMELLRQWALATESIIPLSFAECLIFAYRLSDFQAQRAAFAILATHLPARNFATLRRIALFFHTTHVHPAVFCRAGIPLENALLRPYWKDSGSGREQMRFDAAAKMLAVLVDEFEFVFETERSDDDLFPGSERIPEKDRVVFFRDLRQGCLFLGLRVSEKLIKEAQKRVVISSPAPPATTTTREPAPKPMLEAPESPKKSTSPRQSLKTESPRISRADSPRIKSSDPMKRTTTHLVKCSGCDGEMQIVIVDGKIYHASCSPVVSSPPKQSLMPLSAMFNIAQPAEVLRTAPVSDVIYAPLPSLPRRSEPGDTSVNKSASPAASDINNKGTSTSAPMAPVPIRHATPVFPSQDELLQAMDAEEMAKAAAEAATAATAAAMASASLGSRSQPESKDNDASADSSKGHKRNPSWTHASPSVRLSVRETTSSRSSGAAPSLAPVPKPPPSPSAPAPTGTPDLAASDTVAAAAADSSSGATTSSVASVPPLPLSRPMTPTAIVGSRRAISPSHSPSFNAAAGAAASAPGSGRRPMSPPPLAQPPTLPVSALPQHSAASTAGSPPSATSSIPSPTATAAANAAANAATIATAAAAAAAATAAASAGGQEPFSDDPDAAEIERLADLIEAGRFSDVEAYLLLLDQPQVEVRARKLSIVLSRKLSETQPPPERSVVHKKDKKGKDKDKRKDKDEKKS